MRQVPSPQSRIDSLSSCKKQATCFSCEVFVCRNVRVFRPCLADCQLHCWVHILRLFMRPLLSVWLSEIHCRKGFPASFDAAGEFFPNFLAAQNAILALKIWALPANWPLEHRPRLQECSWIFSSETVTVSFKRCFRGLPPFTGVQVLM